MSLSVSVRRPHLLALAAACGVIISSGGAFADVKTCQALDQRYEQIERSATSIEINAMLFSAADKGCEPLAKRLLDDGASLEARDGRGFNPLARAGSLHFGTEIKAPLRLGTPPFVQQARTQLVHRRGAGKA